MQGFVLIVGYVNHDLVQVRVLRLRYLIIRDRHEPSHKHKFMSSLGILRQFMAVCE